MPKMHPKKISANHRFFFLQNNNKNNTHLFTYTNEQFVVLVEVTVCPCNWNQREQHFSITLVGLLFFRWDGRVCDPIHTVSALRLSACVYVTRCLEASKAFCGLIARACKEWRTELYVRDAILFRRTDVKWREPLLYSKHPTYIPINSNTKKIRLNGV